MRPCVVCMMSGKRFRGKKPGCQCGNSSKWVEKRERAMHHDGTTSYFIDLKLKTILKFKPAIQQDFLAAPLRFLLT